VAICEMLDEKTGRMSDAKYGTQDIKGMLFEPGQILSTVPNFSFP